MKKLNQKWEIEALYNASSPEVADMFNGKCLERYIDNKMSTFFDQQAILEIGKEQESSVLLPEKIPNSIECSITLDIDGEDFLIVSDCDDNELLLE